jgi:transposase
MGSATVYGLIETPKANGLEPYYYFRHALKHIAAADTVEKIEALLPWNAEMTGAQ